MKNKRIIICILLIMSTALLLSCTNNQIIQDQQVPNQQPEVDQVSEATSAPTDTSPQIIGETITSNRIENQEGGYFVPIPDSWFGKVSYELDGTHTYIYHITRDKNELELNPIILHIDASTELSPDTPGTDIFMHMDKTSFYEILRMDAPYSPGSEDDIEFLTLYEDVPQILQSVWVLDESLWQELINNPTYAAGFFQYDARIEGSFVGQSTKEETLATINEEHISYEETIWGATGDYVEEYEFSFGKLTFVEGILTIAIIENNSIYGPRDFRVGDHIDDVIAEFTSEVELDNESVTIFYRFNPGDDDTISLPPSAVSYKYVGESSHLSLSCFDENSDYKDMTIDQLKDEYMYIPYYNCNFFYGDDGIITHFNISYLADAE